MSQSRLPERPVGPLATSSRKRQATSALLALTTILTPALVSFTAAPAQAASVSGMSFTAGGVVVGGVRYQKSGESLTLTVTTDSATECVELTGDHTATQTAAKGKTSWPFELAAKSGSGVKTVTATAYKKSNSQGKCNAEQGETLGAFSASYTLDNTGPIVTGALTPAANNVGWNKSDVTIKWTATDPVGVPTQPGDQTVTANTVTDGVTKTATAADALGNGGSGSVLVKLDKDAPTVTPSRTPVANGAGWNNTDVTASFTTSDALSGVATEAAGKVFGEGANQSHTGKGVDVAGNETSASVSGVNVDKTNPTLSGAPTTDPNGSGWYKGDVVIAWTAGDALSGLAGSAPANSTITGEGEGLTVSQTVIDRAGNGTTAGSPAVKIDRTAPTTNATAPQGWNSTDQTVTLTPSDTGSGVASTRYKVGNGAEQTGTSVGFTTDGQHELTYWSVDRAGNAEAPKTVTVKVDKTAPTIFASQSPAAVNGWNNSNVTVSFRCEDTGSGIASCSPSAVISEEGRAKTTTGTATDNAGNTATATQTVNLDKTPPVVTGSRVPAAGNTHGWNNTDVVASFTTTDPLSGVATAAAGETFGQGANQSVTGTGTDVAGNSASDTVGGVNVDKTDPLLSGTPSTTGWSRGDVTVTWTASDALSQLDGDVPAPTVVKGEGDDLSASASVKDKAGNTTATTVRGIKIDRTAPSTSVSVPDPLPTGWYDKDVEVTLTGVDRLSGVAETFYSVDDGPAQEYTGKFIHALKGEHTITFWSVDKAGNVEDKTAPGHSITLKLDGTPPTTTISLPAAFASGWYADKVTVAFAANDAESGVAKTYYSIDNGAAQQYDGTFMHTLDGTHFITFWSVDSAGNVEDKTKPANTVEIKVDTSKPTITGSRTPAANTHGWNNTDVKVSFVCKDEHSGVEIENCTPETPVQNEGAGQSVTGVAKDNVGKTAETTVGGINIDKTAPSLSGEPTIAHNAAGWYKGDVTVDWTAQDGLSGIVSAPADTKITSEGSNLGTSAKVQDKAGNETEAHVAGIKIDRKAPVVTGAVVDSTPTAGWYKGSVRVRYTATDPKLADGTDGSGVADQPEDDVLATDGANQTSKTDSTDRADNTGTGTVTGINIDSKAPTSSAVIQCEGKNNFCKGAKATIALSAVDQAGLSGVKELLYSTDGGKTWTTLAGATGSFDITLNRSGTVTVQFKAEDVAGNVETANVIEVKYDTIAPTVSHKLDPAANAAGWNKADTTVTFSAVDDSDGSGVDPATLTEPVTVSSETSGQVVTGGAEDLAGNKGTDSVTVKLDKTLPTISGAATTQPNANGWYNSPVTIKYSAEDKLSGLAESPKDEVVTTNGAGQSFTGTAVDVAGNSKSTTVGGISIDTAGPEITIGGVKGGGIYTLGAVPAATCSATDALSGLSGACEGKLTGGTNGVGTFTYTATATDKAGNTTTTSVSYSVIYAWSGFLQPINDTAHSTQPGVSIFKGGSTIPAKFQVKDANGQVVQVGSAAWTTPSVGTATSAAITEDAYSDSATTGGLYKWDATAQQYIYNWSTKGLKSGLYYRIGVKLDDGMIYSVSIGLR